MLHYTKIKKLFFLCLNFLLKEWMKIYFTRVAVNSPDHIDYKLTRFLKLVSSPGSTLYLPERNV
jgi:hypothetical protein